MTSTMDPRGSEAHDSLLPQHLLHDRTVLEEESRRACLAYRAGDGEVICRVLGRYIMSMDVHDIGITPHLCLDGYWESWITLAIARTLRPGWHCVDVGANHGYYTVLMAAAVGQYGRVLAIEPNSKLCRLLKDTIELNGFTSVAALSETAASSDDARTVRLAIPGRRGLLSTIVDDCALPGAEATFVTTMSVDTLTSGWPQVDFVKIDAEGAEHLVWSGMARTIARNPNIVIVLEFTPRRYSRPGEFVAAIEEAGFPLRYIDVDGGIAPVSARELIGGAEGEEWYMLYLSKE